MKPVIAVTPEAITLKLRVDGRGAFCGASYSQAIEAAGGVPMILPLTRDTNVLDELLEKCHGLMLTGGGDVCSRFYSSMLPAEEQAAISDADDMRDDMEIHLVRKALKADLPTLGICRGIQLMNVALGGTLIPDIALRRPDALPHRNPQPDALAHRVEWASDSRLKKALGNGCERVNTSHHQAVDRVAPGLAVTGRAPDGIVEAMEEPTARFFCAVQFHPERLVRVAPQFLRLFEALVTAARSDR